MICKWKSKKNALLEIIQHRNPSLPSLEKRKGNEYFLNTGSACQGTTSANKEYSTQYSGSAQGHTAERRQRKKNSLHKNWYPRIWNLQVNSKRESRRLYILYREGVLLQVLHKALKKSSWKGLYPLQDMCPCGCLKTEDTHLPLVDNKNWAAFFWGNHLILLIFSSISKLFK